MANAQGTGRHPNDPNSPRSTQTGTAGSEVDATTGAGNVKVYDNNGGTGAATSSRSTTTGSWGDLDEDASRRRAMSNDPAPLGPSGASTEAPVRRGGTSMIATIIGLIVLVLIIYFVVQLLF